MATADTNSCSQRQDESVRDYEKMSIDLPWNDNDRNKSTEENELTEEATLSQKMSQLSTSTTNTTECLIKEIKSEIEKVPDYLTKRNKSFQLLIHQILSTKTAATISSSTQLDNTDKKEELRSIAILIYKIMMIQTYQHLWTTYLKSGIGQLIMSSEIQLTSTTALMLWPKEIKTMLPSQNMTETGGNDIYIEFVNNQLNELQYQLKRYQMELNIKANNFQGYSLIIQKIIEAHIEQNLQPFRMEIEHKVELLHYDYHIRALKLEYFRHKPNEHQKQLMKEVCQSQYEQEMSEQEYRFLQQQIAYYTLPSQSFECSTIGHCSLIDSIQEKSIRQKLLKQYQEVAEQSRDTLLGIYLQSAEGQREVCMKKCEANLKKLDSSQYSLNDKEKISTAMLHLINQRCHQIRERIKCIYKYQSQFVLPKS